MASKVGMAGGIPERRLRQIWDAIDSRQFKNALKLSTSLLAKYPTSPYALALKALILERMGRCDEALSVCLSAKELLHANDSMLMDDLILSTLQIVFHRLDRLDLATGCYEYACEKFPNNMQLMVGLFNCYGHEYSFVKQQQIAIKMYKIAGEEKFLLWAVCSIQLQVLCGNGGEKLLLLAEGLLKKHIASHSLHEPEALMVYISVLEQQAKYGDALEILSGKLGLLIMIEVDRLRMQGRLLARSGDYAAAADIFQRVLELCPDDWEYFLYYLGCLLEDDSSWRNWPFNDPVHLLKSCKVPQLTDEVFHSRISTASALVQKLRSEANSDFIRCPELANIEIERRKLLYGQGDDSNLMEALVHYFYRFGHLACFASDIEAFLQVITHEKMMEFLEKLMSSCNAHSTAPTKALGQSITLLKVQEIIGNTVNLPLAVLDSSAVQMAEMYCKNLPLSKDLDIQETMHGEELLSMACNVLVQLFWQTRKLGYLLEAIMIMEFGLTIRRYVWQYKILLLHLYSHLGALTLAYEWYKSLDVKNILLETVSHHILPQILLSPLWEELNNYLTDYLKFMDEHLRESANLTFLAYGHRTYTKAIEFVQFKQRLQLSNQYLIVRLEVPNLQLRQNADKIEDEECVLESLKNGSPLIELTKDIGCKTLTFNEDLQLRPWWTPTSDENYLLGSFDGASHCPRQNMQQMKEREANVRKAMEWRSLLPRMVYLSIQCASASFKENVEANGSLSKSEIPSELGFLLERYAKVLGYSLDDAIAMVATVSSGQKSFEVFGSKSSDIIIWMNFAVFLSAWNFSHQDGLQHRGAKQHCSWHTVDSLLEKYILEKIKFRGPLISSPWNDLPVLVQLVTEPLAWHCLIIQSCQRSSLPSGKKKKRSGPSTDHSNSRLSHVVSDSIQSLWHTVGEVTKWLEEQINRPEDESVEIIVSSVQSEQPQGPGQVFKVIEDFVSSMNDFELGDRISQAIRSWNPSDVARKIVTSQRQVLSKFLRICESKSKTLHALKQQIPIVSN